MKVKESAGKCKMKNAKPQSKTKIEKDEDENLIAK